METSLGELTNRCESFEPFESIEGKLERHFRYYEEEIEIRIESLKEQIEKLGDRIEWEFRQLEEDCCNDIGKLESLSKFMQSMRSDVNKKMISIENVGRMYTPSCVCVHEAIRTGDIDDIEYYLVNEKTESLGELMLQACTHRRLDIVKILLWKNNANGNAVAGRYRETPIIRAANRGFIEIVNYLISRGVDVNARNILGRTALLEASRFGFVDVVMFLIENNANVNETDMHGRTALMFASECGAYETVDVLIANNADVNHRDNNGQTAIMLAAKYGHVDVVRLLIKNNVNVNIKDKYEESALMIAYKERHVSVTSLLIQNDAQGNMEDERIRNAFSKASQNKQGHVVHLLINNNTNTKEMKEF